MVFLKLASRGSLNTWRRFFSKSSNELKSSYDAIIVGAGHNGLISASYLAAAGLSVAVFERRPIVGGAAVTEEIVPGFKFSRASYLLSLIRPSIWADLNLEDYNVKYYFREPNAYTPLLKPQNKNYSLTIGGNNDVNAKEIGKFSAADAENFIKYEDFLNNAVGMLEPIFFDMEPLDLDALLKGRLSAQWAEVKKLMKMLEFYKRNAKDVSLVDVYELMTAPISKVLGQWFDSEILKATLATDGMIGAVLGVDSPGSGYVLLHHVMGGVGGRKGAWAYVEGGMGGLTSKLRQVAEDRQVQIFENQTIKSIEVTDNKAIGVVTQEGKFIRSKVVLSNATPKVTFVDLIEQHQLPQKFLRRVKAINYKSGVVAVKALPNFTANPNQTSDRPMPHHFCTIHLNTETLSQLQTAYTDVLLGNASRRPMMEVTVPSSLDPTLAPKGCHVVQLFTQFAPYEMPEGYDKVKYAQQCIDQVEEYAPGFKSSVIGYEVLCPADLERVFNLTGGNIFHGEMSLDQLYFARMPVRAPATGLYLCGSGTHPGGGVMGAPGKFAAGAVLEDIKKKRI